MISIKLNHPNNKDPKMVNNPSNLSNSLNRLANNNINLHNPHIKMVRSLTKTMKKDQNWTVNNQKNSNTTLLSKTATPNNNSGTNGQLHNGNRAVIFTTSTLTMNELELNSEIKFNCVLGSAT